MCVCVRVRAKKLEFTCKLTMSQNQTDVFFFIFLGGFRIAGKTGVSNMHVAFCL